MADVELLPLPRWMETYRIPGDDFHTGPDQYLSDRMQTYARANVAHATAAKDAEIDRLREKVDALAKDAAKYRWGINNARWIRGEHAAYVAIPVARDADLSCVAMIDAAIDAAIAAQYQEPTK